MDVPAGFAVFELQGPFLEHIGPVHALSFADVSLAVGEREVVRARAVWVVAG